MKDFTIESLAIAFGKPLPISDACECQEGLQEAPESKEKHIERLNLKIDYHRASLKALRAVRRGLELQ